MVKQHYETYLCVSQEDVGGSLCLCGQVPLFTPCREVGGTSFISVPGANSNSHLTSHSNSEWAQRRLQNLALDLAIISHLPLRVKEKLILFPSIYVNTLLQSLNIGNSPTRGRSLFFFG